MAQRLVFERSNEIGCYAILTNTYALVAAGAPAKFVQEIEESLNYSLPLVETSCAGLNLIGRMFAGNSHGLIVPNCTTDDELNHLKSNLPKSVQVTRVDENLSALGNHVSCNDYLAIINPDLQEETE